MLNGTFFRGIEIINLWRIKLYKILNFNKLLSYQTDYVVHLGQEKLVHFLSVKRKAKPRNMQIGPNSHRYK